MPQHQPFIQYSALENAVFDCKMTLVELLDYALKYTNKIALLGAQVTAHPKFVEICNYIAKRIDNGENIEISCTMKPIPSLSRPLKSVNVHTKKIEKAE